MHTETYLGEGHSRASSQSPASASSILVADCGTVFTKVSLLGLVEGQYRLMARGEAPTTALAPHKDITKGIVQAINEIEFITGPIALQEACKLSINAVQEMKKPNNGDASATSSWIAAGITPLPILYAGAPEYVDAARRMLNGYAEVARIETLVSQEQLGPTSM